MDVGQWCRSKRAFPLSLSLSLSLSFFSLPHTSHLSIFVILSLLHGHLLLFLLHGCPFRSEQTGDHRRARVKGWRQEDAEGVGSKTVGRETPPLAAEGARVAASLHSGETPVSGHGWQWLKVPAGSFCPHDGNGGLRSRRKWPNCSTSFSR